MGSCCVMGHTIPANLGNGEPSLVNAAKMAAKISGPVPWARALAPYRAPWTVPCTRSNASVRCCCRFHCWHIIATDAVADFTVGTSLLQLAHMPLCLKHACVLTCLKHACVPSVAMLCLLLSVTSLSEVCTCDICSNAVSAVLIRLTECSMMA